VAPRAYWLKFKHRLEAARLALPVRPVEGRACGAARGGGRVE